MVEQGPAAFEIPAGQALGSSRRLAVQHGASQGGHPLEVVLPVPPHSIHRGRCGDLTDVPARSWKLATNRATCRAPSVTSARARTSAANRRLAGMRRMTTRWSQRRQSGPLTSDVQTCQAVPLLRQGARDAGLDICVGPGDHPDEVVAADDPDDSRTAHHREALDVRFQHALRNDGKVGVLVDGVHLRRHQFIDPTRYGLGRAGKRPFLRSRIGRGWRQPRGQR